jgi:hypothetical protein
MMPDKAPILIDNAEDQDQEKLNYEKNNELFTVVVLNVKISSANSLNQS